MRIKKIMLNAKNKEKLKNTKEKEILNKLEIRKHLK